MLPWTFLVSFPPEENVTNFMPWQFYWSYIQVMIPAPCKHEQLSHVPETPANNVPLNHSFSSAY